MLRVIAVVKYIFPESNHAKKLMIYILELLIKNNVDNKNPSFKL